MTRRLAILWLALAAALPGWVAAGDVEQAAPVKFSDAETRMWMTDQLHRVTRPLELHYEFHKTGSFEADLNFDDKVVLVIEKINADGSKNGSLQFFSGTHAFPAPAMTSATVNPILGHYLYGDVLQMNRLTDPDGQARERWRYFQRAIKFALAETAKVKTTSFEFDGRRWQGYEIAFAPYNKDPKRKMFEKFADKRYTVLVSDDLPGYLYRIETIIPSENPAQPLIREVLQLIAVKPRQ
jgi:hypothetical protein